MIQGTAPEAGNDAGEKAFLTTREVAAYLGLKERKIYDLVAKGRIPCTRAAGKWLFPRERIDQWLLENLEGETPIPSPPAAPRPPAIIAGSHDPLLDWAVRESECGLAVLFNGSLDGLARFAAGEALACGLHLFDPPSQRHSEARVARELANRPVVVLEWGWRRQGLMVAPGNPAGIDGLATAVTRRFAQRQPGSGSQLLLEQLLAQAGLTLVAEALPLRSETDVALAVASGAAEVGLGVEAAARPLGLDFLPLTVERYDLVVGRWAYFEAPFQRLMAFARQERFAHQAAELGGYDISHLGRVHFNGPE
ncbi:MAG: substrate-binding domain-containing protein [Candidatus Competibacterales bacterium]